MRHYVRLFALAVFGIALAGCGDDNNGGGAAFSSGPVSGFGSIRVNGVEWKVAGATLRLDDNSSQSLATEDSIKTFVPEGAFVTVKGRRTSPTTGTATTIEFKSIIEGPMAAPRDAGSFTVAGLTVTVDGTTRFLSAAGGATTFAAISTGTRVEVAGVPESGTVLRATMVRAKASTEAEYEAKGYVVAGTNFGLSLVSGGPAYLNVSGTAPAGAAIVEVKGASFTAGTPAGTPGTLVATIIRAEDRLLGDENDDSEVEGIITGFTSADNLTTGANFSVSGQQVRLTATTSFVGAGDPANPRADLADGIKVEVEGDLRGGVLVAEKLKFKDAARISARVVSTSPNGFTVLGTPGLSVIISGRTRFDGVPTTGPALNDFIEVRGYPMSDGTIFAQRVRPESGGNQRHILQGVVTSSTAPSGAVPGSLSILGLTVPTNSSTEFRDSRGGSGSAAEVRLSQSEFYSALVANQSLVKVRWREEVTSNFTGAPAQEAELEGEDD